MSGKTQSQNTPEQVIGLDVGVKRVGIAFGTPETGFVTPHAVLLREKYRAEKEILALVREKNIRVVIVGLPLSESGRESNQAADVRNFARRLTKRSEIEIFFEDEYASTVDAEEVKLNFDLRAGADAIAAALILQAYFRRLKLSASDAY